jgi:trehalose 6-phosphate synthase/phosphatase
MKNTPTQHKRLLIISNRLPVSFTLKKGLVQINQSSGGLVSSIGSYVNKMQEAGDSLETIWIGSSDLSEPKFKTAFKADNAMFGNYRLQPVFLPRDLRDRFYNGFCNDTLWPLFHYFPSYAKFNEDDYLTYCDVNRRFAEKVMEAYQPGDLVWIHDYHLMLLPALLRAINPAITIGFFLHIPFPSFELFRLLPSRWRKEILEGLLGSDLIGFHTNDYAQYFLKSVRHILGYDDNMRMVLTPERSILVDVFPVSVDYEKFHHAVKNRETLRHYNLIENSLKDQRIIASVDRLDYTKGIVNRLEGFELFLEKYPAHHKKVSYLLLVVPSRDIIARYRENKKEIEQTVSRINGKFGAIGYSPVIYQYRSVDFYELTGLYLATDIALITPVRDGMNLVAKEFVATWSSGEGVLILSETAGAATELGEALLVNPTDRHEIADTLNTALNMPSDQQVNRNRQMQKRLKAYDVVRWAEEFITLLEQSKSRQEVFIVKEVNTQIEKMILDHYSAAHRRLFLLDYDGTLSPFARVPQQATPSAELIRLLDNLGQSPQNTVVIISGRPMENLTAWFGDLAVNLVAEHGTFIRQFGKDWENTGLQNMDWKKEVLPIVHQFSDRCPGSFIEEKQCSIAWHYRNANADLGFLRSRELVKTLDELSVHQDFQVMDGHKVVELRSRGSDKGTAAMLWLNADHYDFILAVGDDKTDEDMFRAIPVDGYSIRVGMVTGSARYNFRDQKSVLPFLKKIESVCQTDDATSVPQASGKKSH